jgi:hypothetical protein
MDNAITHFIAIILAGGEVVEDISSKLLKGIPSIEDEVQDLIPPAPEESDSFPGRGGRLLCSAFQWQWL